MNEYLAIAILTGLGGMLAWGSADFFAKKSLEKVNEFALTFWVQIVGIVPVLLLVLARGGLPEVGWATLGYLVLFGLVDGISDVLLYRGFSKGQLSILSPIFASYAGLVIVFSVLFFGESLSAPVFIGLVTTFLGIMLINFDFRDLRKSLRRPAGATGGVLEIIGATTIYALWLVLFDKLVSQGDWAFYLLAVRSVEALGLLAYARLRSQPLRVARSHKVWPYVALVGLLDIAAYSFLTLGFSRTGYTSVVAVLSGAFSLPTLVLAHFYLKEKITKTQLAAVVFIIGGVAIVAAF
jgi:drug/metabolite transporter (DMT)-like permease